MKTLIKLILSCSAVWFFNIEITYTQTLNTGLDDIGLNGNESDINQSLKDISTCLWDTRDFAAECLAEVRLQDGYTFFINHNTGKLMYGDEQNPGTAQELSCMQFCGNNDPSNVIAANANLFSNQNDMSDAIKTAFNVADNDNPFETGAMGIWYLKSTHKYKTDVTNSFDDDIHIYEAGAFKDFKMFDFTNENFNNTEKWLELNTTTFCTPDGKPMEEKNIIDIYSVQKYGYNNMLAYLSGNNCDYESALFESFDGSNEISLASATGTINSTEYHSGKQSYKFSFAQQLSNKGTVTSYSGSIDLFSNRTFTELAKDNGLSVKIWVKSADEKWPTFYLKDNSGNAYFANISFTEIARSGSWKLLEARVPEYDNWSFTKFNRTDNPKFGLKITAEISRANYSSTKTAIYIDDIRMQPLDAQMATYVYDPSNFKLLAQFDTQHFGMYYQYNQEGKLVRVLKETIEGTKTVEETQYHLPSNNYTK